MLRIVGGRLSGRRFRGPGKNTRPTSERVREAVFSALEARGRVAGANVLDLFSGTGAFAYEALSRGAARAMAVDRDRRAIAAIRDGALALGLSEALLAEEGDLLAMAKDRTNPRLARSLSERGPFDLIFADPPYAEVAAAVRLLETLSTEGIFTESALIVVEHAFRDAPSFGETLASVASYRYGDTGVVFLTPAEPSEG
jgi:16S rRNA (guanine966-N2)-methyltransferase